MPILRSSKVSQSLNKLETQISKHQNTGKASVQKVVQPLADQIPPSSPPNITSYITTKQLPNTAPIAKGSTMQLPIRVTSSNLMDYNLGKEEALSMQLQLSPELPLFNFNKEDN
jgi:hypothetical protein